MRPSSIQRIWVNSPSRRLMTSLGLASAMMVPAWIGCGGQPADSEQTNATGATDSATNSTDESQTQPPSVATEMSPADLEQAIIRDTLRTAELEGIGRYDQAIVLWRDIIAKLQQLHGEDAWQVRSAQLSADLQRRRGEMTLEQRSRMASISEQERRGDRYASLGQSQDAVVAYTEALQVSAELWGDDCPITLSLRRKLGAQQQRTGDEAGAMTSFLAVINGRSSVFGADHPVTLDAIGDLARLHEEAGRYDLAVQQAARRIDGLVASFGERSAEVAEARNDLGTIYLSAQDWNRAERELSSALELRRELFPADSPRIAHSLRNLAMGHLAQQNWNECLELLTEAIDILEIAQESESVAELRLKRGSCYLALEDLASSEADFGSARAALEPVQDLAPALYADACFKEAYVIGRQGRYDESLPLVERAYAIQQTQLAPDDPVFVQTGQLLTLVRAKLDATRIGSQPSTIR